MLNLRSLAKEADMSIAQLAFSFVRDTPGVDSIVIGAVNREQIRNNIDMLSGPVVGADLRRRISELFSDVEEEILTPGTWKI